MATKIIYDLPSSKREDDTQKREQEKQQRQVDKAQIREQLKQQISVVEARLCELYAKIFDENRKPHFSPASLVAVAAKKDHRLDSYRGYFSVNGKKITLQRRKILHDALSGKIPPFLKNIKEPLQSPKNHAEQKKQGANKSVEAKINDLLSADYKRAMLPVHDTKLLSDPNRGHWDLWDLKIPKNASVVHIKDGITARDPETDIDSGIVGIDFGTKSTVVVYMDDRNETRPLRVGGGEYSRGMDSRHYENPTVLEFRDIDAFMKAYRKRDGRPFTSWEDIIVSHRASDNLKTSSSDLFYSFFSDLKKWCGSDGARVKIRDGKGHVRDLPPFMELKPEDMNPLEIYAYYLGLYINNMMNQKIFLHYILSFPVTFSPEICEQIRVSFERGIKKSLPTALLSNAEAMENFYVRRGVSEPAAYAVTALTQYGFDPMGDDECYYGVFDFGGGTTDFDFGVYRDAKHEKHDRYDYALLHFGANGDRTLGGENLLGLLAFEIFRANANKLLNPGGKNDDAAKIPFTWAADKRDFPDADLLIRDSQEAHANMHNMMERLRPIWEEPGSKTAKAILEKGIISINLFDENGKAVTNVDLHISPKDAKIDLENILEVRIEQGIREFFLAMREAFAFGASERNHGILSLADVGQISIFLAGNSSKSPLVKKIFDEYLADNGEGNSKAAGLLKLSAKKRSLRFTVYPPLGTEDAVKMMAENDIATVPDSTIAPPTGKTGVAYGLLECRDTGIIRVETITPDNNAASFKYYIGRNARRKFQVIIDRHTKMNQWYDFIDAGQDFELYYTENPEAATGDAPIKIARRIRVHVENPDAGKRVYIRPIGATAIEYITAKNASKLAGDGKALRIELP